MRKKLMSKYSNFYQSIIIFCLILSVFLLPLTSLAANLKELEQQKNAATQKANDLKKQAADKQGNINSIAALVKKLSSDIASYQSQINTTQKNMTGNEKSSVETENQIQIKQAELEMNMKKQTEAIQTMYVMGRKSTIETLIASESFSEVMARQQYLSALSGKIESMMKDIKQLKTDLEAKRDSLKQHKLELSIQKEQLVTFKVTIVAQRSEQDTLLNGALAEKNAILANAKKADQEVKAISSAIYNERQKLINDSNESISVGGGSYPYSIADQQDPWGFYTRECTGYAAWYWNEVLGRHWERLAGYGDAWGWPQAAASNGVTPHSEPRVGSIISWARSHSAPYGHVAIVHKINNDDTIDISEYNYVSAHVYSYRTNVNPGSYGGYSYIY